MTAPGSIAPISFPAVRHRLAVVVRCVDAFTMEPVTVPLRVDVPSLPAYAGMPPLPWRAVAAADGTYRLLTTGHTTPPVGGVTLRVVAPGGEYVDAEPVTVVLPRPLAGAFPTRADMLVTHVLWPTRRLTIPAGEMAVIGSLRHGAGAPAANYRVRLAEWAPTPATPYAYTDEAGDFLYRLPFVRALLGSPLGGTIRATVPIDGEVRPPPAYAGAVATTAPAFPVPLPVGRTSTLLITIP